MTEKSHYVLYPFVSGFGGIERLIIYLARFLHDRGDKLSLLCFSNALDFSSFGGHELKIELLSSRRSMFCESRALRNFVHEREIPSGTVLALELRGAMYAGAALSAGYTLQVSDPPSLLPKDLSKCSYSLARRYGVEGQAGTQTRVRGQIVHWLTKRGVGKAANRITMTKKNADELQFAYDEPFVVVPQGVDLPHSPARRGSPNDGTITFLSVCRLEPSKRVDAIIRSFANLIGENTAHSGKEMLLRIVGDGSQQQELKNLARTLEIGSRVEFLGLVSDDELEEAYTGSDVFVMPAKQGYGLPGLESIARGLHLIVHRESGVSEILESTPRVQIIDDCENSLIEAMRVSAETVPRTKGDPPRVPTSDQWASSVVKLAGW